MVVLKPNDPPPPPTQPTQVPANTVFVAKQNGANVYVIAIAGTNPPSLFDWNESSPPDPLSPDRELFSETLLVPVGPRETRRAA